MQWWEVFMVFLVYLSHCSPVGIRSDDSNQAAQAFLVAKEAVVRAIAEQAAQNYNHTCDFVRTCGAENCSRRECSTTSSLKQDDYSCVYVNNYTRCHNRTGSTCDTVQANFKSSIVRIPPLNLSGSTPEKLLGTTICTQRQLDSKFKDLNTTLRTSSNERYFYNLYFGSVDGVLSYYPGRELLNADCGQYDPRIRPWYTAAISVLKDVVVLLDTGSYMNDPGFFNLETSLDIGKSMTKKLVQTLTSGDRVTVIPVNNSDVVQRLNISQLQYDVGSEDILDLTEVTDFVENILNDTTFSTPDDSENLPSNFTAGFLKALSIFNDTSPSASLKIVILITDTVNYGPPADFEAAGILENSAQLFVYDLSGNRSSGWGRFAACQGTGENQQLFRNTVVANPLLSLNSYFSFLARSRIEANNGSRHFWAKPYIDATNLGNVITASYPAMSSDGLELLGVAGIDVQTAGLDPVLESNIDGILRNPDSTRISRNPGGASITSCSDSAGYLNLCSDSPNDPEPFCGPTLESNANATDEQLTAFMCCTECTGSRRRPNIALWVSVGVLAAAFVVLLVAILCLVRKFRNRKSREELSLSKYSFQELRQATNGFDSSNIVGKGAFGVVYKADFGDEMVAVKQLTQPADRAEDFQAELKILGLTSHPNLVELKGTCFQATQCFLVYEFVENGDLYSWLWPGELGRGRFLTWNQRRKIARGLARGLDYLHRGLLPNGKVFHLDIKPRNILLEGDFNPKIADFGISQLYEPGYTFRVASVVRGTFGYFAPEVLQGQIKPTSKLDVYSYGMVLLQLVSGRKIDDPLVSPYLLQWARDQVNAGNFDTVVDEDLIDAVQENYRGALMTNCRRMVSLAFRCLSDSSESRPEMPEVLGVIDGLRDVVDLESSASSDFGESARASADFEKSADAVSFDLISTKSKSNHSLARLSTGEFSKSFNKFRESQSTRGIKKTEQNPDETIPLSGPLSAGKHQDFHHSRSNSSLDSSTALTGFSVESPYETALEFPHVQPERHPRSFRRSFSS